MYQKVSHHHLTKHYQIIMKRMRQVVMVNFYLKLFYLKSEIFLELDRDFVEQLNELSSKQHRRQYSGLKQYVFLTFF